MHSDHKRTHLENRFRVCLVCGDKGNDLIKGNTLIRAVQEYVMATYDPEKVDDHLPGALCSTHRRTLYEYASGRFSKPLHVQDLAMYGKMQYTRSGICGMACLICNKARATLPHVSPAVSLRHDRTPSPLAHQPR